MNFKRLSVELQSFGVRFPESIAGRKGGAGPAEGQVIILGGRYISIPSQSHYVSESPYAIRASHGSLMLYRDHEEVAEVLLPTQPCYYDEQTPEGVTFDKLALVHGKDCLASTVYQDCRYRDTDSACLFCGIALSLFNSKTTLLKDPAVLGLVAEKARLLDGVNHVTLTTGIQGSEQATIEHLCQCVQSIKKQSGLPVHVQICPPGNTDYLQLLKSSGVDTLGIHIESFDEKALSHAAPAKAEYGLHAYINAWKCAVSVFGKNQVSSFLIAGLGENQESILSGAELLCDLGVFPYLLPLRPIPGTRLQHARPPEPEIMRYLYEQVADILKKHRMSSALSKAGCVRCGVCSSISLFEYEPASVTPAGVTGYH